MATIWVVVTDANILINLIHVRHLSLLGRLIGFSFVVPDEVVAEVLDPEQEQALREALGAGILTQESICDTAELELFATLTSSLGKGESACLAIAQNRGWLVASDEGGAFRREATARLGAGRILNTAGLFLMAIRAGVISVEQADEAKAVLEQRRFRMKFGSFRDLTGE
jgi:predicted nucleic acid-binding protein